MKTNQQLQFIIANILVLHCTCLIPYENPFYHSQYDARIQKPRPIWGCIQCTYANRASCCRYFQRCCSTANFPTVGSCSSSDVTPYCADKCTSDGQCPSGQKCCPPSNFVCLLPFGLTECPLTVSPTVNLRPCTSNVGCFANEFCCPNPRTPGCCASTTGSSLMPVQNPLNTG